MSIYGYTQVDIIKQPEQFRWLVLNDRGQEIVGVPWRFVYDQQDLIVSVGDRRYLPGYEPTRTRRGDHYYNSNLLNALEACLFMAPLTETEEEQFFQRYGSLRGRRPWVVSRRGAEWEPVPAALTPSRSSAPTPECSTPEDTQEVPDPERKLLV